MAGSEPLDIALTRDAILDILLDDGKPMDTPWHRAQMNLLLDLIRQVMSERGRSDYYVGGNMFICYSMAQARALVTEPYEETQHLRDTDVFWVGAAEVRAERRAWIVWEEQGRYPDLIIELLSPTTSQTDRTTKKDLYEHTFRTPDYFMYDRDTDRVEGFHLVEGRYRPVQPDARGRWRIASLELWLGTWHGLRDGIETVWLRLYDDAGRMIPTPDEAERQRADAERARADAERARADAAEAEVARLRGIAKSGRE